MKKIAILYSITLILGAVLILGINHWTTATHQVPASTQHPSIEKDNSGSDTSIPKTVTPKDTPAVKKKPCDCCEERMTRLRERIQKIREHKQRENNIAVKEATSTGNGK